jgi:hypothetical protein
MSGLRRSREMVALHRRRGVSAWLLGVLLALSLALPGSASAAGITFVAPPGALSYPDQSLGPAGYTEAPVAFRTTDTRPTIAIQADGGTQLQCHFDNVFVSQTCGGPGPGCAAICGSFQPAAPLGPDSDALSRSHFLAVDLMDADGDSVASVWVNLDVDTTPPLTRLQSAAGVLSNDATSATPLRPTFGFEVSDSNSVGTQIDTVACAWGPATSHPAFAPCGGAAGSASFSPGRLPARHRLYRLQVRGTDDFGRTSTATGVYDPIPCALTVIRPSRIASLVSSGVATRVTCDSAKHVAVAAYTFMINGDRAATPRGAVSEFPILGEYRLSRTTSTFTVSRQLRLSGAARGGLRRARSVGLVVAAGDPDKIESGLADDSLSYQVFTLRH